MPADRRDKTSQYIVMLISCYIQDLAGGDCFMNANAEQMGD